jgi:hypothetical protein
MLGFGYTPDLLAEGSNATQSAAPSVRHHP